MYGDQVLRALQMIKRGYVSRKHKIPPLNTFDILSGCKTGITGSHLSKDNVGSLVNKAISYLLDLTPPKQLNEKMDHNRSAAIRPYLDVQDGDRAEGNLFRYINHYTEVWLCHAHVQRFVDLETLEKLTVFADDHGGYIDLQQATLRIQLRSEAETDLFLSLLKSSKLTCDISIKMNWKAACLSLEKFCYEIATSCPVVLEIEGVTFEVHPQEPFQSIYDFFQERSAGYRTIRLIIVLNYPRPQDLSINVGHCSLQTKMTSVQSSHDWVAMGDDLLRFTSTVNGMQKATEYEAPARELRLSLKKHGMLHPVEVTIYGKLWNGGFDLLEGTLVTVCSSNLEGPKTLAFLKTLRSLTQDITNLELVEELYRIVRNNTRLQELNISILGRDMICQVEPILQLCRQHPRPFTFKLYDRTRDKRGRVIVQVAIYRPVSTVTESNKVRLQSGKNQACSIQAQAQDTTVHLECLQWDCDHFYFHFSDLYASLLDSATKHHPTILTSLSLHVFALTETGLACVQRALARSSLGYLCIMCTPFEPILSQSIAKILENVPWHSLKFLVLTGENIDGWIKIWTPTEAPRLLRLDLDGSGSVLRELSHSSVLAVHRLIYSSSLVDLHLGNVYLQDINDWSLLIDSLDPLLLEMFDVCLNTAIQFMSATDALDLFYSRFRTLNQNSVNMTVTQDSFTLDVVPLQSGDRVRLQDILRRSTLQHLRIMCASFDHRLFDDFSQVIGSVPWSTLTSLVLSGDDIDAWIQLLNVITAPQLRRLVIQGPDVNTRKLPHASALIIQRLIRAHRLVQLKFENVLLQETSDWVDIIDSMDPLLLKHVDMCDTTWGQFLEVEVAVNLYNDKFQRKPGNLSVARDRRL
ncbi:hypothetical protein BG000_006116, partial [Podila horticola]